MKRIFISALLFQALAGWAESEYPRLGSLRPTDILFSQLQEDIRSYYRGAGYGRRRQFPTLSFFIYRRVKDETIFMVAARLNLPYETIATCNGLSQAREFLERAEIIVPNMPGLFVPEEPANALEQIMAAGNRGEGSPGEKIVIRLAGMEKAFFFHRGERFHAIERAYFLRILFKFPLTHAVRTSNFGPRSDPFTGRPCYHRGIDLAAPVGTAVFAAREGVVKETGYNDSYGKFVRIAHPGGYETLYGHLSVISVGLSEKVGAGSAVGKVGVTGRTTGPHLHFEILKSGKPVDPSSLL